MNVMHLSPLEMTPLAGPQTVHSAWFQWVFPKNVVLTHGEQWKLTQSGRFPQSRGAESETTRFCRCLGTSSSYGSLRNNDPSQRSNHNNRVGRCRWCCASNGKPCNIVGCVRLCGGCQACQIRSVSVVDACVIRSVGMRPASEHTEGRISELWQKFEEIEPVGLVTTTLHS